jgi:hypothetical protein
MTHKKILDNGYNIINILGVLTCLFLSSSDILAQQEDNFEGIIKYKNFNPRKSEFDTMICYITNSHFRQMNLSKSGLVSNIYIDFNEVPNKSILLFCDGRPPLVSISKGDTLKYEKTIDTASTEKILNHCLRTFSIIYEKSYPSNDLFFNQVEYKIYYSDSIQYIPPKTYKEFGNIMSNGTGKIALKIETLTRSGLPAEYQNNFGPSIMEAYEIIEMKVPDSLVRIPKEIKY